MSGELPPDENELSLDPRDPRGETDPMLEVTKAILDTGPAGTELDAPMRELLGQLLKRELTTSVERAELTLITDGVPSEAAAEHLAQEVDRRTEELATQTEIVMADWTIPEQWPEQGAGNVNPPVDPQTS